MINSKRLKPNILFVILDACRANKKNLKMECEIKK